MTAVTFTFDSVASTTVTGLVVRDVKRPLLPTDRSTFVEIPGRDGSWLFEDAAGDRELTLICAIAAGDDAGRRTSLRALAALIYKTGRRNLVLSDESDRYWLGKFVDAGDFDEVRGYAGDFDLRFRADPFAYSTSTSTQVLGPTTTEPYSTTFNVTTDADTPYVVDVAPTADITGGFTLTVNGDALTYGTTLASGSTVQISSVANTVKLNGALAMSTVSGTFGKLVNGVNSITFDRSSGTASTTLTFSWRRRYL